MFHAAHEALAYCLHASLAANIKCSFVEDFRTGVLVISTIDDSSIFVRAIQDPQSLKWSCHFYHADQPNESSCYFRYLQSAALAGLDEKSQARKHWLCHVFRRFLTGEVHKCVNGSKPHQLQQGQIERIDRKMYGSARTMSVFGEWTQVYTHRGWEESYGATPLAMPASEHHEQFAAGDIALCKLDDAGAPREWLVSHETLVEKMNRWCELLVFAGPDDYQNGTVRLRALREPLFAPAVDAAVRIRAASLRAVPEEPSRGRERSPRGPRPRANAIAARELREPTPPSRSEIPRATQERYKPPSKIWDQLE